MLGLCFLILIGVALVADGLGLHIPRGYIYFAMAFAGAVETINVWAKGSRARNAGRGALAKETASELANQSPKPPSPFNAAQVTSRAGSSHSQKSNAPRRKRRRK